MKRALFFILLCCVGCADGAQKPAGPGNNGINVLNPEPDPEPAPEPGPGPDPAPAPDPEPEVLCDGFEPDGHPDDAPVLAGDGAAHESRICVGDEDWVAVALGLGDLLEVTLSFEHGSGDLDMVLYDPGLEEVASAESTDDDEVLSARAQRAGLHYLQIYGYEGVGNTYALEVEKTQAEPPCQDDAFEENDTLAGARGLLPPESFNATICAGDDDLFVVELGEGETIQVSVGFSHAEGDLDLTLTGPGGARVAESATSDDGEVIVHEAEASGPHLVRVFGYGGAEAAYRLDVSVSGGGPVGSHLVSGRVRFDDPFLNRGSYDHALRPLSGVVIEAVDEVSGEVLGQGSSDGSGRYRVRYEGSGSARVYVRVLARRRGTETTLDVVTSDRRVYAVRSSEAYDPGELEDARVDIDLTEGEGLEDPFNAVDAINRGLEWWSQRFSVRNTPRLHVIWEEGGQFACGTCYRDDDEPSTIYLYGLDEDNDALDDPVILHELGHFLMNKFSSDDSPGGSHDGTPVDPRLAYAEGWATAFSGMVRGDPVYYDTRGESLVVHDIETPDEDYGTFTGGSVSDPISEYLVAAIMWDFFDSDQDEGDRVEAAEAAVHPLIDYLDRGAPASRGAQGIDFIDYVDGAFCLGIADADDLGARLSAASFPYPGPPRGCKPGNPVSIEALPGLGQLEVVPGRALDGMEVLRCGVGERCVSVLKTSGAEPVIVDEVSEGWLEVRLWRGGASWVGLWAPVSVERRSGKWRPGPDAADGSRVVERALR